MQPFERTLDETVEGKLRHLYVALAISREVAERSAQKNLSDKSARSIVILLNVASSILEEILDVEPNQVTPIFDSSEIDLLM